MDIVHEIAKHMRKLKLAASCRLADAKGKKMKLRELPALLLPTAASLAIVPHAAALTVLCAARSHGELDGPHNS